MLRKPIPTVDSVARTSTGRRSTPARASTGTAGPSPRRSSGMKRGRSPAKDFVAPPMAAGAAKRARGSTPARPAAAATRSASASSRQSARPVIAAAPAPPGAQRRPSASLNSAISSSSGASGRTTLDQAAMSRAFLEQNTHLAQQLQHENAQLRERLEDQAQALRAATQALEKKEDHADYLLDEVRELGVTREKERAAWAEERIRLQERITALKKACTCGAMVC